MHLSISHDMSITKREIVDWRILEFLKNVGELGDWSDSLRPRRRGVGPGPVARRARSARAGHRGVLMLCGAFVVVDALIWIAIGGA
jgi:hypothetical protein